MIPTKFLISTARPSTRVKCLFTALAGVTAFFIAQSAQAANTADNVLLTGSDLMSGTSYSGGVASGSTSDVTFTSGTALNTPGQFNIATSGTWGSLNDLNTGQSIVIGNNNGAANDILSIGNLGNTVAPAHGGVAGDEIFVAASGTMTIVGTGTGGKTLTLSLINTGNIDNAGTLSISASGTIGNGVTISFTGAGATTYSGNIIGVSGAVTVNDAGGSVTFSGNDTYAGATLVSSGTLNLSGTINGTTGITVNGAAASFIETSSGLYTGTKFLTLTSGLVTLGGTNNYSGNTTLTSGTLNLNVAGAISAGTVVINGGVFNENVANGVSGAAGLTVSGNNTLTLSQLNNYTGATTVTSGTLNITGTIGSGAGTAVNVAATSGMAALNASAINSITGTSSISFSNTGALANIVTLSASNNFTGTIFMGNDASNVLTLSDPNAIASASSFSATAGTLNLLSNTPVTFNGPGITITSLTMNVGNVSGSGSNNAIAYSGTITATSNGHGLNVTGTNGDSLSIGAFAVGGVGANVSVIPTTANVTIGSIVNTDTSGTNIVTLGGTNSVNSVTGSISNGPGSVTGIAVNGTSSVWTLSGSSTYTGNTTLSSGTLVVNNANAIGSSGTLLFSGGGLQSLVPSLVLSNPSVSLTASGTISGAQSITLSGSVGQTASTTLTSNITPASGLLTISGPVNIGAATGSGFTLTLGGTGNTNISGNIEDYSGGVGTSHGTLTITNTGITTLSGSNSYQGATSMAVAGTLVLSGTDNGSSITINNASGVFNETSRGALTGASGFTLTTGSAGFAGANTNTGATALNGGTTSLTGTINGSTITVTTALFNESSTGVITGTNGFTVTTGSATLGGSNNYTGATSLTNTGKLNLTGTINGSSVLVSTATAVFTESASGLIAGGTNTFTLTTGSAILGAANTYGGGTILTGGTMNFVSGALGSGTLAFNGGQLQYAAGNTSDIAALIGASTSAAKIDVNGNAVVFTNPIGSALMTGLTLTTSIAGGSLTLGGANLYTGLTTVTSGTLIMGTGATLSTGDALTTAAGATYNINGNSEVLGLLTNGGLVTNSGSSATLTIGAGSTGAGAFSGSMNIVWVQGNTTSTLSGSFNNTGTITDSGTGTGTATITGTLGSGISSINQTSTSSPFTVSTSPIVIGSGGLTVTSTNAAALFTVSSGIAGSSGGNLTFNDNGSGNITDSGTVNPNGNITNSGVGSGTTTISGSIGSNVGSVTQNSATSTLALTAANTFTGGLFINTGTVTNNASNNQFLGSGTLTLGTAAGTTGTLLDALTVATAVVGSGTVTNAITLGGGSASGLIQDTSGAGNSSQNYTGNINLNGKSLTLLNATSINQGQSMFTTGTISGAGNLIIIANGNTGTGVTVGGVITSSGTIFSTGTGTSGAVLSGLLQSNVTVVENGGSVFPGNNSPGPLLSITGSNATYGGNIIIQSGVLNVKPNVGYSLQTGTGVLTMGLAGSNNSAYLEIGGASASVTLSNSLINLAAGDTGTLVIENNYYSQITPVTINSPIALNGDTLTIADNVGATSALAMSGSITGLGNLNYAGELVSEVIQNGNINIGGYIGSSGFVTINGIVSNGTYANVVFAPSVGTITLSSTLQDSGGLIIASGSDAGSFARSSSGALYGDATGLLSITGSNNIAGQTQIQSGVLELTGATSTTFDTWLGTSGTPILIGNSSGALQAELLLNGSGILNTPITIMAGNAGNTTLATVTGGTFAGTITLNKTVDVNGNTASFNGTIATGSSAPGAVSVVKVNAGTTTINGNNTYNGGTVVAMGIFNPAGADSLGSGGVVVEGGLLRLTNVASFNLTPFADFYVGPYGMISVNSSTLLSDMLHGGSSQLDSNSTGALGLSGSFGTVINLSNIGNGNMYLGADVTATYNGGPLGADADGNYRLGWANGVLTVLGSDLGGTSQLIIGGTAGNTDPLTMSTAIGDNIVTSGKVLLSASNGYSGGTVINPYSLLTGQAQTTAGASPFGIASGSMTLHDSSLQLNSSTSAVTTTTVGTLTFDGNSTVTVAGSGTSNNTLALGAITRNSLGTLQIAANGASAVMGSTVFVTSTGSAALIASGTTVTGTSGTLTMLAPYLFDASGNYLTYGAHGIASITTAFTALPTTSTNDIVSLTGATNITASGTMAALSLTGNITNTGSVANATLGITAGGLNASQAAASITIGSTTVNTPITLDFSGYGGDAVINTQTSATLSLTIDGIINAPNGLTKTGAGDLNLNPLLSTTGGTSANLISGTIAVDEGWLTETGTILGSYVVANGVNATVGLNFYSDSGLGSASTILLNGGGIAGLGSYGSQAGGTLIYSAARTILIGEAGGFIGSFNQDLATAVYPSNVEVDSLISGTGAYVDFGTPVSVVYNAPAGVGQVILTNTSNNFAASINVYGRTNLVISNAGELGNSGNVLTLDGGNAILAYGTSGTAAIAAGGAVLPTVSGTIANPINFLDEGGGVDVVALTNGGVTLTLSGPVTGDGSFYKNGLGTLALTGTTGNTFNGSVIVNAGILSIDNGSQLGLTTGVVTAINSGAADISGNAAYVEAGAELDINAGTGAIGGAGGKTLYVSGTGAGGGGAINNVSGTNSDAGQVILQANTTIATGSNSQLTLSDGISDSSNGAASNGYSLTTVGNGTLVLSGSSSYSGNTTITGGNLVAANSVAGGSATGSGTVTVTPSFGQIATLSGNGFIGGQMVTSATSGSVGVAHIAPGVNVSGANDNFGTAGVLTLSNGLTIGNGTNLDYDLGPTSDLIAVTGNLSLGNNVILNFQSLGGIALNTTYDLINFSGSLSGSSSLASWMASGTMPVGETSYTFAVLSGSEVTVTFNGVVAASGTAYWQGALSGTWATVTSGSTNFTTDATGTNNASVLPGAGTNVKFTANSATNLNTVLGQDFTINSLEFTGPGTTAGTTSVTIGGTNTLTIMAGGTNGNTAGSGIVVDAGSAAHTISSNLALGSSQTWTINGGTLTVGNISDGGNGYGLTKSGTGTLDISGSASYSGTTAVTAGALRVDGSTSGSSAVTVNAAILEGTGTVGGTVALTSGTLRSLGTLTLLQGVSVSGSGNVLSNGTIAGNATQNAASAFMVNGTLSGSDTLAAGASLSGTGFVGATTLNGTDNLSSAGTLTVASLTVNNGGNTISSGTVDATGGTTLDNGSSLAVNGTLGGGTVTTGSGSTLTGTGTITGGVTVSAGGITSPGGTSTGVMTTDLAYSGSSTANFNVASGSSAAPQAHLSHLYYSQMVVTGGSGAVSLAIGNNVTLGANSATSVAQTGSQILSDGSSNSGVTLQLTISSTDYAALQANASANYNAKSGNTGLDNYFVFNLGSTLSTGRFTTLDIDVTGGMNASGTIFYSGASDRFATDGVGNTIGDVYVNGQEYALSYTGNFGTNSTISGNDIVLTAIPEPSTWGMILGGFGMLIGFQRFRKRRVS